jgi:hypothetical protein
VTVGSWRGAFAKDTGDAAEQPFHDGIFFAFRSHLPDYNAETVAPHRAVHGK